MKTFGQLRDEVLRWMDEYGDTDTSKNIVENALNQAHAMRVSQYRYPFMVSDVYTFTQVNGQRDYILHERVHQLDYLFNRTQKAFLKEVPARQILDAGYGFNESAGSPQYYEMAGLSPVAAQPAAATTLTCSSTVAESGGVTLYVEGEDANGAVLSDTLTPGGGASAGTYTRVTRVRKNGTWQGTMTLTGGATTVLTLSATEYGKSFPLIRLLNVPTAADTIEYRFRRKPLVMAADNDIPDLPFPYSNLLVYDALLQIAAYNEIPDTAMSYWRKAQSEWESALFSELIGTSTLGAISQSVLSPDLEN